tara:strand:+ start:3988 stop:4932 length:945 start_codon:yes stop_codon:yes gene_type:complete
MENIIYDNEIDPVTANLAKHIAGCRPSINEAMGWNKWRKSLRHFSIPNSSINRSERGWKCCGMDNTYAELVDVLPEEQTYPFRRKFRLSPIAGTLLRGRPVHEVVSNYWKYIKIYYVHKTYGWNAEGFCVETSKKQIPFAVWGRDGRVRIAAKEMKRVGKINSLMFRLNNLMGLGWQRTSSDRDHGIKTIYFQRERRKLQIAIPQMETVYWDSIGYLPVVDGDVYNVNTGEYHSRLLDGKREMTDILADISPTHCISSNLRNQFREAPNNPTIRSAIRAEINAVIPNDVQDEQSLDNFFRQRRTIVSESGVFAL